MPFGAYADLPEITLHPLPQTVLAGNPVTLRAVIEPGGVVNASWWRDGEPLPGESRSVLEIDNAGPEHQGYYRAAFRNAEGANWSREVFLRVLHRPAAPGVRDRDFVPPDFDASEDVRTLALLDDGRLIAGGEFEIGSAKDFVCLLPDGSVDPTYNPGGSGPNKKVRVALQTAGGLLLGGDFTSYNGIECNSIVLLDENGVPVPSFRSDLGFDNDVLALAEMSDGRILAAGKFLHTFTDAGERTAAYVARLFSDGRPDTNFEQQPVGGATVDCIALDDEGRIVVGGSFTEVGGVAVNERIGRLLPDGSRDPSFVASAAGPVRAVAIGASGEIYIGGDFQSVGGVERKRFARLLPSGAPDLGYRLDGAAPVGVLAHDPRGRLMVGGRFFTLGGEVRSWAARLHANGVIDPEFEVAGLDAEVRAFAFAADGRIAIAGRFGHPADLMLRVFGENGADSEPSIVSAPQVRQAWVGERTQLGVIAEGGPNLYYVWKRDGEIVDGAHGSELPLPSLSPVEGGSYSVTVSNGAGFAESGDFVVRPRRRLPGSRARMFIPGGATSLPLGGAVVSLDVADSAEISSLAVELDLQHPNVDFVELSLVAPDGTRVILLPANWKASGALLETRFEDDANATINQADPPATGVFRPAEPLSIFDGKSMLGEWRLEVEDARVSGSAGELLSWGLEFTTIDGEAGFGGYLARFGAGDPLRYGLGVTPDDPPPALELFPVPGGYELNHWRWPEGGDVSYRYEIGGGELFSWVAAQPVLRDRQRFPNGLERVTLTIPYEGGSRLVRLGVNLAP